MSTLPPEYIVVTLQESTLPGPRIVVTLGKFVRENLSGMSLSKYVAHIGTWSPSTDANLMLRIRQKTTDEKFHRMANHCYCYFVYCNDIKAGKGLCIIRQLLLRFPLIFNHPDYVNIIAYLTEIDSISDLEIIVLESPIISERLKTRVKKLIREGTTYEYQKIYKDMYPKEEVRENMLQLRLIFIREMIKIFNILKKVECEWRTYILYYAVKKGISIGKDLKEVTQEVTKEWTYFTPFTHVLPLYSITPFEKRMMLSQSPISSRLHDNQDILDLIQRIYNVNEVRERMRKIDIEKSDADIYNDFTGFAMSVCDELRSMAMDL